MLEDASLAAGPCFFLPAYFFVSFYARRKTAAAESTKLELTFAWLARLGALSDLDEIFSIFSFGFSIQVYLCRSMPLKEISIKRKR